MKKIGLSLLSLSLMLGGCVGEGGSQPQGAQSSGGYLNQVKSSSFTQIESQSINTQGIQSIGALGGFLYKQLSGTDFASTIARSLGINLNSSNSIDKLFDEISKELQIIEGQLEQITAGLEEFEKIFARNNYYNGENTLADIFANIDFKYSNLQRLFSQETSKSFSTVKDYAQLQLAVPEAEYKNVVRQIGTIDNMTDLELMANELTDTKTPISFNYTVKADRYFLLAYYTHLFEHLKLSANLTPWDKNSTGYNNYQASDVNGIELKAGYYSLVDYNSMEILNRLQEIASIFQYMSYEYFIKQNHTVNIPSFVKVDYSLTNEANYKNALEQIQNEFNVKAQNVINIANHAKEFYLLPMVGNGENGALPENCMQPNDIPQHFSLDEIKQDWLYWSGYGGKRSGKLLTMCKNQDGKYVSTYPLFLGVPGNEAKNENSFCPYLFYKDEFLFCHAGPSFPSSFNRTLAVNFPHYTFIKDIHIDSASDKDGHLYKFTADDYANTLSSITNFNSKISVTGKLKDHWFEIQTPNRVIGSDGNYVTYELPQTMPVVINFHNKQSGKHHWCVTTFNYDVSRTDKLPSLTAVNVGAKAVRCGNDGQFKLVPNPDHSDTVNVSPWE